jgi:hypothetical protein
MLRFYDFFMTVFVALFFYDIFLGTFNLVSMAYPICFVYYATQRREAANFIADRDRDDW